MGGCCSSTSAIEINGRQYNTKRLLGEGGFSYVFLAEVLFFLFVGIPSLSRPHGGLGRTVKQG